MPSWSPSSARRTAACRPISAVLPPSRTPEAVPVYVDEAWGPHFHFHPALPPSAMASGVDGAVSSTHKVLGGLTQAAILNVRSRARRPDRVRTAVDMVQTTSPSVLVLASIDATRRQMALAGEELVEKAITLADDARRRLQALPGIAVLDAERLGVEAFDLTKLVIDVDGLGITGFAAEDALRNRFGVGPEMSDLVGVVCLITIGDPRRHRSPRRTPSPPSPGSITAGPMHRPRRRSSGAVVAASHWHDPARGIFLSPHAPLPLDAAGGEVSTELIIPYPPGIPVLAPGEIITTDKVDYLARWRRPRHVHLGPADPRWQTARA